MGPGGGDTVTRVRHSSVRVFMGDARCAFCVYPRTAAQTGSPLEEESPPSAARRGQPPAPPMGNLCCGAASIAPTNIFTAGDLDDISHQLELFFERVVPRTPRGTLDVMRCERGAVRDAVDQANANVAKRYQGAFEAYALRNGAALPVAKELRETCATLTTEFSPTQPPRCALPPDSDVELLIKLAS